jgi:hypothetical protein
MQQGAAPAKAPISAHPAFPLIVGLWFAALLGLGTIVLPAVVLEKAAGVTGLASVFPQTDAPLTAGARAAFALLATVLGLVGGLVLARRVADGQAAPRAPRSRAPRAGAPPRPLSVHDDLGEEAIAPTVEEQRKPIPGRRRALAAIEDERPSDFLLAAPLPGGDAVPPPELPADEDAMSEQPSDIEFPAQHDEAAGEPELPGPIAEADAPEPYVPPLDTRKPRDFAAPPPPHAASEAREPLSLEPIDAPLEDLGIVQLAERLGRSMQRRLREANLSPQPQPEAEPLAFSAPSIEHEEAAEESLAVPPPVVPDALRAFMDSPPEEFAPQPGATADVSIEVPAPVVPSALQSFACDAFDAGEDEDEDETLDPGPFTLPLAALEPRPFDAPPAAADVEIVQAESELEDEDAIADESYSSLLSMKHPFRPAEEFVRIDEPEEEAEDDEAIEPAAAFPGHESIAGETASADEGEASAPVNGTRPFDAPHQPAPSTAPARPRAAHDPLETERALRSALATLQRMSGAA